MPAYLFTIRRPDACEEDLCVVLPGILDARIEAVRFLGEMLNLQPKALADDLVVDVSDETGLILFSLTAFFTSSAAAPGMARPPVRQ